MTTDNRKTIGEPYQIMIHNILFDMDDVLCTYDFHGRLDRLETETGVPAREIEERIFKSGLEERADSGEFSASRYLDEVSKLLGVAVDREMWVRVRAETTVSDPRMVDLVHTLHQTHQVALLTNNGQLLVETAHIVVPELKEIFGDRFFVSSQIDASKETPRAFTTLLPMLGWSPENTLFVDDCASYIVSARKAGLHTHQFTTCDELVADLRRLDVL